MRGSQLRTITDETHYVSRKILSRLLAKPLRQHEACEYAVKESVSMKRALTVFYWLRDRGFIRKMGESYCSPFEVTEKGKLFYEVLSLNE
jgi:hypothetical protein